MTLGALSHGATAQGFLFRWSVGVLLGLIFMAAFKLAQGFGLAPTVTLERRGARGHRAARQDARDPGHPGHALRQRGTAAETGADGIVAAVPLLEPDDDGVLRRFRPVLCMHEAGRDWVAAPAAPAARIGGIRPGKPQPLPAREAGIGTGPPKPP